jgi:signal transduction histidine kinase
MDHQKARVQSGKSREDLLQNLSELTHQLSQPLTSLHGHLELALMVEMDEAEWRRTLQQALEETDRITDTLRTLRGLLDAEKTSGNVHEPAQGSPPPAG